jgi:hypothetical protein
MSVLAKDATWELLGAPAPHWREALREALSELASVSRSPAEFAAGVVKG